MLRATADTRYLVLELSARGPGHIAHLCQIAPPRLGVVLCVGHAHEGEFGGIEEVARAKGELPAALPARRRGPAERRRPAGHGHGRADRGPGGDVRPSRPAPTSGPAKSGSMSAAGRASSSSGRPASALVQLRLFGEHNVHNALAAAALAGELGMPVAEIAERLSAAEAAQPVADGGDRRAPDGVTVLNDAYNANPEAVRAALDTLAVLARGRRAFAVLGADERARAPAPRPGTRRPAGTRPGPGWPALSWSATRRRRC